METYDVAIIGAGPAGLTAGIYCGRYALRTIIFGEVMGGTISYAHEVGNWPGFEKISGLELTAKMVDHVKNLGITVLNKKIENIRKEGNEFIVEGKNITIKARKVILASGMKRRQLNVPREDEFIGSGISYCNTCDGIYFKNKVVGVVGGGNAGCSSANELADIVSKVHLMCVEPRFIFAEPVRIKQIEANTKIEKHFNVEIAELLGKDKLEGVKLKDGRIIPLDGLFVEIGSEPDRAFLYKLGIRLTEGGFVITDSKMRTNIPGFFSAGTVNEDVFSQAIIAAGEGALAAHSAFSEIKAETNV